MPSTDMDKRRGAGEAAQVELSSFDLKIEGRVTDKDGVSSRAIDFNAYQVLKSSAEDRGESLTEAKLIHDAQQLVEDLTRMRRERSSLTSAVDATASTARNRVSHLRFGKRR